MKKVLVFLVCLCACIATSYAQKGESAWGLHLNYGNETNLGIGAVYRHGLTDNIRIEPSFNYYFKHDHLSMWDLNVNFHYLFPVASDVTVYPLAGVGYANVKLHFRDLIGGANNVNDGNVTINLGGGVDYQLSSAIKLNVEVKYQIIDGYNQLVLTPGVIFLF